MTNHGRAEDILGVLSRHRGDRHVVALQDYPDPDAISSGIAHQRLSRAFGIRTDLVYAGEISRPQNRRLVQELGVELRHPRDGFSVTGAEGAVFVDNQGGTCSYLVRLLAHSDIPAVLIVDHHEGDSAIRPELRVVEDTGATATLYAEILRDRRMALDPASGPDRLLASGLLYGILTDTRGLTHATRRDIGAASWLASWSDLDLLEDIAVQATPWETVEVLRRALAATVFTHGFSFAGVGYLQAEHRDAIPQAAEWLLSLPEVHTSLVFGIVRDWRLREIITGSLRTTLPSLSPRAFLIRIVGAEGPEGAAIGGRAYAGGFEVPVGMSTRGASVDLQLARWGYFEHLLLERLIRAGESTPVDSSIRRGDSRAPSPRSASSLAGSFQEGSPARRVLTPFPDDREESSRGPRPQAGGSVRTGQATGRASWEIGEI